MPSLSCYWKGQICFVIETNTYDNLHKYIWRFPQIDVICLINFIRGQGWLLSAGNAFIKLSLERSRQSVFSLLDQNNHRQSLGRIKWIFFRKYCSYLPFSKSPLIEVFAKWPNKFPQTIYIDKYFCLLPYTHWKDDITEYD